MLSEYFAYVVDSEIKAIRVPRGAIHGGKRFGNSSPDSTYIASGLIPITGTKPAYDTYSQRLTGPTYTYVSETPEVTCDWTVEYIPLAELKQNKNDEVNNAFVGVITIMKEWYTDDEIKSWDKQESEARAYVLDTGASVPLLTAMAAAGATTVSALVTRVIIKADLWATNYGAELGKKQGLEDAVLVAATPNDVKVISW
jgi:hypothetical protein